MNASYFETLARYNIWVNEKLYQVCAGLEGEAYYRERPSYFGSIHNTLNHILVADRIWMRRFTGEGKTPKRLDEILFHDFAGLREACRSEDQRILAYVAALDEADIDDTFSYRDMRGTPHALPLRVCLGHLFNHHTHHRGQVHGLLSQEMDEPPALDLVYFALEQAESAKA